MNDISPKLQNQINQYQQLQQQIQVIASQRYQLEAQLKELTRAIEELNRLEPDAPIYKNVGSLMLRVKDRESVVKELTEQKETLDIRVKTVERQEKHLRERYQSIQDELSRELGQKKDEAN
ncbi:MAG: prefoldin subunit beta [Thermoplasmata archaeon]|uniref:Prefoldin subunit beta n=1 Tax=Candidatus Sysuiplasma superficiale TaxID=2823368 RepID=A0A8J8CA90_9ARCH|nr:prefoldin subunit beta [Candidatus Sysuiplasma superficiale]MBX8644792.1 prefoldin subunit beta [Candidatus Sysuiplasma superficiale]MCL4347449.1 prefoldin subunit beta [Candidatus Thermoplasmatota archaeon]